MSYVQWSVSGFGINVDEWVDPKNLPVILSLIHRVETLENDMLNQINADSPEDITITELREYGQELYCSDKFSYFIADVMTQEEGIPFTAAENEDGEEFIVYVPNYPWDIRTPREESEEMTSRGVKTLESIFAKYGKLFGIEGDKVKPEYQDIINGG